MQLFTKIGSLGIKTGGCAQRQGGLAATGKIVQRNQGMQGELAKQGGCHQADDALPKNHNVFSQQGRAILDKIHGGFHVWQEAGRFGGEPFRQGENRLRGGEKIGGMRLEGKNGTSQPILGKALSQFDYIPNRGIALTQRVSKIAFQRRDIFINLQIDGKLPAVDEHLGTGADG
jgi:hypothetical protein